LLSLKLSQGKLILETMIFKLTNEFIKASIDNSDIAENLKGNRNWLFDTKIYMITGVKIAYDAHASITQGRG
jgi:hypothetical protein